MQPLTSAHLSAQGREALTDGIVFITINHQTLGRGGRKGEVLGVAVGAATDLSDRQAKLAIVSPVQCAVRAPRAILASILPPLGRGLGGLFRVLIQKQQNPGF